MSSCNQNKCTLIPLLLVSGLILVLLIFGFLSNDENVYALAGIQAQLVDAGGGTIPDNSNVIFDTVIIDESDNISYDQTTGEFTITKPGIYYIDWALPVDGAGPSINVSATIEVNGVAYSTASSPIVSGVIAGETLVNVTTVPTTISLVNITGFELFVPATPVQGNIVILEVTDVQI